MTLHLIARCALSAVLGADLTPPSAAVASPSTEISAPVMLDEGANPEEQPFKRQKPVPEEPKPARDLAVGTEGLFQPGMLLDSWYDTARDDAASGNVSRSGFRVRRAFISFRGDLVPNRFAYRFSFDPTRLLEFQTLRLNVVNQQPAPADPTQQEYVSVKQPQGLIGILVDYFCTYESDYADISLGQFRIPVSYEGSNSFSRLLFTDIDFISRLYGNRYDVGLRAVKTFKHFGYFVGLFNGSGQNTLDTDLTKDLGVRFEVYPVDGLLFAIAGYSTLQRRDFANSHERYEFDARFEYDWFLFMTEVIGARDVGADGVPIQSGGFYGALGFTFFEVLQFVMRVGYFDPDFSQTNHPAVKNGLDEFWHYEAGFNYFVLRNEVKFQLSYQYNAHTATTPSDELVFNMQLYF